MRQVREILRLSLEAGLSTRVVGERVGIGPTTVRDTLKRFARAGLSWRYRPRSATRSWKGGCMGLLRRSQAVASRQSRTGR